MSDHSNDVTIHGYPPMTTPDLHSSEATRAQMLLRQDFMDTRADAKADVAEERDRSPSYERMHARVDGWTAFLSQQDEELTSLRSSLATAIEERQKAEQRADANLNVGVARGVLERARLETKLRVATEALERIEREAVNDNIKAIARTALQQIGSEES